MRRSRRRPAALPEMLLGLDFQLGRPKEVVIVSVGEASRARPFLDVLRRTFLPHKVLVVATEGDDLRRKSEVVPLVRGKVARKGKPTAYVCEQGICQLPTTEVEVFADQLTRVGKRSDPAKTGAGAIDSSAESG